MFVHVRLSFAACGLAFCATACLHPRIGPDSLPRDRALYSLSLADSWKEQTLLNIIKIRYVDPPIFIDVGNMVSSYALTQTASAGAVIEPGGSSAGTLGFSGMLSATPTITYIPLTGSAFIKGLLTPLPAPSVFAAIQNGSAADAILLATLFSINGLKNQQASMQGITPADPGFHQVRALLRKIQLSGAIRMYVKEDARKEQTSILAIRGKDISPDMMADSRELRRLLRLNPEATEFTLVSAPVPSSDTEIAVLTRSLISLMINMAAQVEVPPQDLEQHRAFAGFEKDRETPGVATLIRIHSAKAKPADAFVSVNYRNMWFWIDDGDLESKREFSQLMTLFTMADTSPRENLPVITIPAH